MVQNTDYRYNHDQLSKNNHTEISTFQLNDTAIHIFLPSCIFCNVFVFYFNVRDIDVRKFSSDTTFPFFIQSHIFRTIHGSKKYKTSKNLLQLVVFVWNVRTVIRQTCLNFCLFKLQHIVEFVFFHL